MLVKDLSDNFGEVAFVREWSDSYSVTLADLFIQVSLWVNPTKAVTMTLDSSPAVLFPFFDEGTHILVVLGMGDTTIRLYGIYIDEPYIQLLIQSRSNEPMKGFGFMSRSALDTTIGEIDRVYILNEKCVQPNSIIVPMRSSGFQVYLLINNL